MPYTPPLATVTHMHIYRQNLILQNRLYCVHASPQSSGDGESPMGCVHLACGTPTAPNFGAASSVPEAELPHRKIITLCSIRGFLGSCEDGEYTSSRGGEAVVGWRVPRAMPEEQARCWS